MNAFQTEDGLIRFEGDDGSYLEGEPVDLTEMI